MSSNTWAKITLYKHLIKLPKDLFQGRMSYASYVCVAVMYADKLQFVCEGMLGAWGAENKA